MRIALINASPKRGESASGALLADLKGVLPAAHSLKELHICSPRIADAEFEELKNCAAWVFAFPLYVDAVPSHLLHCLRSIEKARIAGKDIHVYAIVNCGFHEGTQNRNALAIMENWCARSGLRWGMGIGFGGGGALVGMEKIPPGKGPKAALGKAYAAFAEAIASGTSQENIFISIAFPRFLYKLAAEWGWRRLAKANGHKLKDLDRQL